MSEIPTLPAEQDRIVFLHCAGLSPREIAQRVGKSPARVSQIIRSPAAQLVARWVREKIRARVVEHLGIAELDLTLVRKNYGVRFVDRLWALFESDEPRLITAAARLLKEILLPKGEGEGVADTLSITFRSGTAASDLAADKEKVLH